MPLNDDGVIVIFVEYFIFMYKAPGFIYTPPPLVLVARFGQLLYSHSNVCHSKNSILTICNQYDKNVSR